jgi:uncharacterized protein (DUF885 family)
LKNFRFLPNFFVSALLCSICILPAWSAALPGSAAARAQTTVDARRHELTSLFDEEWEYELRSDPEFATALGDKRYNDRLSDHSPEFYQSDLEQRRKFLAHFEAIDPSRLSQQDVLSRTLMIRRLREQIEGAQFKSWEMPVNQMGGPHLNLPDLVSLTPFNSVTDYENYIARLRQIPRVFEQVTANMRQGMKDSLMPPGYLLEKVAAEAEDLAAKTGEASPFAKPVKEFPAAFSAADQKRLRAAVLSAVNDQIVSRFTNSACNRLPKRKPRCSPSPTSSGSKIWQA